METAGVEPAPPRCKRGALPLELHPLVGRTECGRMESNHHSARHRVYSAGSSPLLSVRVLPLLGSRSGPGGLRAVGNLLLQIPDLALTRWPTGFEPAPTGLTTPGASVYTTATTKAGTTGFEPAASRLTSECSAHLSYAPQPSKLLGRGAAPLGVFARSGICSRRFSTLR
jgi:hypothetical protein